MRAAIYCKTIVGKSAKTQENILRRLCQQRGWAVGKVYVHQPDRQRMTGSKSARITLLDDLFHGRHGFGVVCVWRLGMLGLAIDDLLWALDEIHISRHIQIVAMGDGFDTTVGDGMATKVIRALAAVGRNGT